ncbi:MAG: UDP-N-acetylmuramoyl-L-alanyl-D-glutamate--2,6-diaminopimelate ligase [Candidatus Sungbacteria bacterium]|nr:UDP-N-acetylmuramoyl-L-alanyl-D-glutamate--2,6-diaminopimelate ligase [Candidatus Sungbacteria bacterium]
MSFAIYLVKKLIPHPIFIRLQPPYHFILAFLAALWFRFPSRDFIVIGVTGTKGKTTVVELIHEILQSGGGKTASISSLRFKTGDVVMPNDKKMTMPGRFFVQKFLRQAVKSGCRYAVLEVTSEGIKQFRHRFINFSAAVMTNIEREHIESHGSFERYLRAKLDLFWRLPKDAAAIINRGDPFAGRFSASTGAKKIFYGRNEIKFSDKIYAIRDVKTGKGGVFMEINGQDFAVKLPGEFNLYNILVAVTVGILEHISLEKISVALENFSGVPGRMEFVQKEPFAVVVDYAHTPQSLRNVYTFLKDCGTSNQLSVTKLICVLGAAGGGRDKWKRPEFGRIAAEFCDCIILTNEDPYDENPEAILDEIASGFPQIQNSKSEIPNRPQTANNKKILDRREAIREALKLAKSGDTVVITGKGAEPWIMGPNGTKTAWDDREVVREELKNSIG